MAEGPGFEEAIARVRAAVAAPARALALEGFWPASVLVALLRRPAGPTILFTRRTDTVRHHKGEISFPGGRREAGEDARTAALREAEEEVGLDRARVEILGELDDVPSISGYVVTPIAAAVLDPPDSFVAQESEVVEPFELPLALLLDPAIRREVWWDPAQLPPGLPAAHVAARLARGERDPATGRVRGWAFHAGPTADRIVWGLTGHVLATLLDRAFR